jgi:tRNA pseudouridine 55 synthase
MSEPTDGIVLLSKQSGMTSFSSLWQVKNALGTKRIGHTGTLDTFAEGLLVVMTGHLTRLVSRVTDCDKEYEALVVFGSETDTLDPDGRTVAEGPLPDLNTVQSMLPEFTGRIMQTPPAYSAVHVDGKRASDRIRDGETVALPPRPVTIHSTEILGTFKISGGSASGSDPVASVVLRISCSKGTYIRSLARDIALACGSRAHLGALRRTRIGPFFLDDAAGRALLEPFGTVLPARFGEGEKPPEVPASEIRESFLSFSPELAARLGLASIMLDEKRIPDFFSGREISPLWFRDLPADALTDGEHRVVFCRGKLAGMVHSDCGRIRYDFVGGMPS